jgi:hypothetical protein
LKEHVGCFEGDQFKKLRKAIRKLEDADVEEEKASAADKLPPGWWETYGHVTEGKRGMLVGGDPRDPQWDRLKETFRFADLDWVGTEFKSKGLESARSRVLSGGVDLVLPLHRWCGHNADRILQPACKEHGVAFIPVQASYGITGIRLAIERFAEPEEG